MSRLTAPRFWSLRQIIRREDLEVRTYNVGSGLVFLSVAVLVFYDRRVPVFVAHKVASADAPFLVFYAPAIQLAATAVLAAVTLFLIKRYPYAGNWAYGALGFLIAHWIMIMFRG